MIYVLRGRSLKLFLIKYLQNLGSLRRSLQGELVRKSRDETWEKPEGDICGIYRSIRILDALHSVVNDRIGGILRRWPEGNCRRNLAIHIELCWSSLSRLCGNAEIFLTADARYGDILAISLYHRLEDINRRLNVSQAGVGSNRGSGGTRGPCYRFSSRKGTTRNG